MVGSAVIRQDGRYLLIQECREDIRGKWNFPGGRVDPGETLEQATEREAKEESGFTVTLGKELIALPPDHEGHELHAFAATITGGELRLEDGLLGSGWFTLSEVQSMKSLLRNSDYVLGALEQAEKL
jgi:ADP-ribose pyrophosphatase YjhB (NUDIX family)